MKKKFFSVLFVATVLQVSGQQVPTYTPQQLAEDFHIFKTALTEAHPGLYRFTSPASVQTQFDTIEKSLNQPMTEEGFFKLLDPVIAKIGCGHTNFHRDGKPDDPFSFHDTGLCPLKLYFRNGKAYLLHAYIKSASLKPGTEIISINGKRIQDIITNLFQYMLADGRVISAKYVELNQSFEGYYATLIGAPAIYRFGYIDPETKRHAFISLPAVTHESILKSSTVKETDSPLQLSYPAKGVALLRIAVFMPVEGAPVYEDFLKTTFQQLKSKSIQHLIIDLRNNEGGMDRWGEILYSYLSQKPFWYYDQLRVTQNTPFTFLPYATGLEEYEQYKPYIKKEGNRYLFTAHQNLGLQQPQPDAYSGNVYILQNGKSFSVTAEFAAIAKDNHRALFFGEESGGAISGNNSGTFVIIKLPNTHLTIGIPLAGYYMRLANKHAMDRGILPDYTIIPSVQEVLRKEDAVLKATLGWIERHDSKK